MVLLRKSRCPDPLYVFLVIMINRYLVYTRSMNYDAWARSNKKAIAKEFISKFGAKSTDVPMAVFTAGIPGAGKTEFLDRLFQGNNDFVRMDLDEIVKLFPGYSPEKYYLYRGGSNIILEAVFDQCREKKFNFVMDGTLSHAKAVENIRRTLKRHTVVLFYIWQEPQKAWQLTKDRELLTKRGVSKDGFINACLEVPKNLKLILSEFSNSVIVIAIKKSDDHEYQIIRDPAQIDTLLSKTYTRKSIEGIIL